MKKLHEDEAPVSDPSVASGSPEPSGTTVADLGKNPESMYFKGLGRRVSKGKKVDSKKSRVKKKKKTRPIEFAESFEAFVIREEKRKKYLDTDDTSIKKKPKKMSKRKGVKVGYQRGHNINIGAHGRIMGNEFTTMA